MKSMLTNKTNTMQHLTPMQELNEQLKKDSSMGNTPIEWVDCMKNLMDIIEFKYLDIEKKRTIDFAVDCGANKTIAELEYEHKFNNIKQA